VHQERTEEPTARRRERARSEGRAPRSQLLSAALSFAAAALLWNAGLRIAQHWPTLLVDALDVAVRLPTSQSPAFALLVLLRSLWSGELAHFLLIAWAAACAAAVASALLAGSPVFAPSAIVPRWSRLSLKGAVRRIASVEGAMNACGGAACATVMIGVLGVSLRQVLPHLLARSDYPAQFSFAVVVVKQFWWQGCILLLCAAALDVGWQRRRHRQRLRMTLREVRDERAETETRPEIKQQRRSIGVKRGRAVRLEAIRRASAILTNPQHIAVALRYAPPAVDVPVVVARGAERMAHLIRAAAAAHDIPVIESAELARRIFARVDVDEPIPEEYYAAVAAVFAWIIKTRGRLRRGDEEP